MDQILPATASAAETEPVAAANDQPRPAYPPPPPVPAQDGPRGIKFDFNLGARVLLPAGSWRIRLRDLDTGNTLFESETEGALVASAKRFYVRFGIEVWADGAAVFTHQYDCTGRDVVIMFPVGTLGDILAWFPYARHFAARHRCRLICAMGPEMIGLLGPSFPDIRFVTHEDFVDLKLGESAYATYCMGLFFEDEANIWQPTDFRQVGLHKTAAYILGVDPTEAPPVLTLPDESRPVPEPYVCIAVQSSTQCKHWNNPGGWHAVIAFLKSAGYRVICIDKNSFAGAGMVWNHIPHGAEDQTGDRPLAERARWLRHASAFIGLSSGLSWLAWYMRIPVVLISGFTHPTNEFATPYRVINWHTCNACWNDVRVRFDHQDFLWCPRHAGSTRQFECTRLITAEQVISTIRKIPGLAGAAIHQAEQPGREQP